MANEWIEDRPEENPFEYWGNTPDEILEDRYDRHKYGQDERKPFGRRHLQLLQEIQRRGTLRGSWDDPHELAKFALARLEV